MNAFQVVTDFEHAVAEWTGAPYAVAVDSCSSALFLACRYLSVGAVSLPRTYCSVPAAVIHAGGRVEWRSEYWSGEYRLDPYPIVDSAGRFRRGMYRRGEYRCVCFHWTKALPIGKGGMILHDNPKADEWFRLARYSGRHACDQFADPGFALCGWNVYMDPAYAARGLTLLKNLAPDAPDCRNQDSYPPLEHNPIYRAHTLSQQYGLPEPHNLYESWSNNGLVFRPVTLEDGPTVVKWRNDSDTRQWFCSLKDVTLETHAEFMAKRRPNDHVWMVEENGVPVGMHSIIVSRRDDGGYEAETGRFLVDPARRGTLLGIRIDEALHHHCFHTLRLTRLWCEVFEANTAIMRLRKLTGWTEFSRREHERGTLVSLERWA